MTTYSPGGVRATSGQEAGTPSASLPLHGVRVVELGNYIAGPMAGRLLADFGADVIKVERPQTGDELRNWRLYAGDTSMLFHVVNRNKRSVELDLRTEAGQDAVLRLAARSDILIENFRPGTLERWGIGPEQLAAVNPSLVLVRISAFGQTGPKRDKPGYAAVSEAYSGFRGLVGEPDRPPSRVGVSIGDSIAGTQAAFGAMVALFQLRAGSRAPAQHRRRPVVVDVALNEAMLAMMESLMPDYSAFGVLRERTGGRIEGVAPSNAYVCRDGRTVVVAGNGDGVFRRLMSAIDRADLATDPRYASNAQRWTAHDELDRVIQDWCGRWSLEEVVARLEKADVPVAPIYSAADLVEDEQLRFRGMVQYLDVDTGEEVIPHVAMPGISPTIGETSLRIRALAPRLGQHTEEVLSQLVDGDSGRWPWKERAST